LVAPCLFRRWDLHEPYERRQAEMTSANRLKPLGSLQRRRFIH
jgi:hypothetical protein